MNIQGAVTAENGGVVIQSSVESRPMSIGGSDNAVAGINLTDAELANIVTAASGTITFGDTTRPATSLSSPPPRPPPQAPLRGFAGR